MPKLSKTGTVYALMRLKDADGLTNSVDYLSQHFEFLWYSKLNFFKQIIFLNFFIVINAF